MKKRVIVWGTGNVGAPALRAVLSHQDLELVGVVVSSEAKDGKDAGELAELGVVTGVKATRDWRGLIARGADAVVYAALAEVRFEEAVEEVLECLRAGINVVTSTMYFLQYAATAPEPLASEIREITAKSGASLMASGIDPGWGMDSLPLFLSAISSDITEIRSREIFNYKHYDQPNIVRNVVGFGLPMDQTPPMLMEFGLKMVWEPMVRALGDALNRPVDAVSVFVERRPLEKDVSAPGMGVFEKGTQGAFRFEVVGHHKGKKLFVVEHITRIDNDCAPDWPYPPEGEGCHAVVITGNPTVHVSVHSEDRYKAHSPGAGGNATAACRIVNAIPFVCDAPPGIVHGINIPMSHGGAQIRA